AFHPQSLGWEGEPSTRLTSTVSTPKFRVTSLARVLRSASSACAERGSIAVSPAPMLVGTSTRNAVSCCNMVASRSLISGSPSTGRTATLVTFKFLTASLDWSCDATQDCSNGPKATVLLLIESTATAATHTPARQPCSRKDP